MFSTVIATVVVIFTFAQASTLPPVVSIANATVSNVTREDANVKLFPISSAESSITDELVAQYVSKSETFQDSTSSPEIISPEFVLITTQTSVTSTSESSLSTSSESPLSTSSEISLLMSSDIPLPTMSLVDADAVASTDASAMPLAEKLNDPPSTNIPEEIATTIYPDETTGLDTTEETSPSSSVLPEISIRGTVINCYCNADEVLVDGVCQPYPEGTKVLMRVTRMGYEEALAPMSDKRVMVKDLVCDTESGYLELTYTRQQFRLRDRGDIVLTKKAGELSGLRAGDYCISHFLDDYGKLTWTAKVCIEPPNVPRCCPPGQAMKNNVCQPARSPEILRPPISADPYGEAVSWPFVKNFVNTLHCPDEPMKDIPFIPHESYLASHTDGVVHIWILGANAGDYKYTFAPKYCVDGRQNLDGSTSYSIKMCFENPRERHHRICDGNVCVRKCCQYGEIMDQYQSRCIPDRLNTTFEIRMNTEYKVVVGVPLCHPATYSKSFLLSPDTGHIAISKEFKDVSLNDTYPPDEYCIDHFRDREGKVSQGAVACLDYFSWWEKARNKIFPACQMISIIFLLIIVMCYVTVPVLLNNAGKYHLCHVLSLVFAYTAAVLLQYLNKFLDYTWCVTLAISMQFGFLSTFFWLSVLCFDVWRLFRSLNCHLRPPKPVPVYAYHIFAWGGPFIVCLSTLIIQSVDTTDIPWIVRPNLGDHKCWFAVNMEQLVYFYIYSAVVLTANCIFIGHTYWHKRQMDKSLTAIRGDQNGNCAKPVTDSPHRNRDVYSEFITKFLLLSLMSSCWVTEILSWQINPQEIWAVTDVLNTLQGFFIFLIFISDRRKRTHLKEKFPKIFGAFKPILMSLKKVKRAVVCSHLSAGTFSPSTYISTLNRKLSSSSLVSNLSTLSTSLKLSSTSTLKIRNNARPPQRSKSVTDDNGGIIALSFTPVAQADNESYISSASSTSSIC